MADVVLSGRHVEPRGLSRAEAARRCGVTESGFSTWVAKRIVPGPIPGTRRWDAKAIDMALDRLSGLTENEPESVFDRWERENAKGQAKGH